MHPLTVLIFYSMKGQEKPNKNMQVSLLTDIFIYKLSKTNVNCTVFLVLLFCLLNLRLEKMTLVCKSRLYLQTLLITTLTHASQIVWESDSSFSQSVTPSVLEIV